MDGVEVVFRCFWRTSKLCVPSGSRVLATCQTSVRHGWFRLPLCRNSGGFVWGTPWRRHPRSRRGWRNAGSPWVSDARRSQALCRLRSPNVQATIWRVRRQRATHNQRGSALRPTRLQSSSSSSTSPRWLGKSVSKAGSYFAFSPSHTEDFPSPCRTVLELCLPVNRRLTDLWPQDLHRPRTGSGPRALRGHGRPG